MKGVCVFMSCVCFASVGTLRAQPASETLEMWDGQEPPRGTVTEISLQGVEVMLGDGSTQQVGWERVREVKGERREQFEPLREDARLIWRASARLERGDTVNAEPILESLFERVGWSRGAASSLVSNGLLRCRVEHGSRAAAVTPWLGVLVTDAWSPGGDQARSFGLIDRETGLAPALPPVWLNSAQSIRMSRETFDGAGWIEGAHDGARFERLRLLGELYKISASFELAVGNEALARERLGEALSGVSSRTLEEEGVSMVLEIVLARIGTPEQRAASRAALQSRLDERPAPWKEAWIRSGIGRSLVREPDPETKRLGVIQLLHVPARLSREAPGLASLALAESALTLRSLGWAGEASTLRRELLERFPGSEGAMLDQIVAWVRSSQLPARTERESTEMAAPRGSIEGMTRS